MIRYYDEGVCGPSQMFEVPDGDWCRREDVEAALAEARANACTPAERAVLDAWARQSEKDLRAWALCSRVAEETCEAELARRAGR